MAKIDLDLQLKNAQAVLGTLDDVDKRLETLVKLLSLMKKEGRSIDFNIDTKDLDNFVKKSQKVLGAVTDFSLEAGISFPAIAKKIGVTQNHLLDLLSSAENLGKAFTELNKISAKTNLDAKIEKGTKATKRRKKAVEETTEATKKAEKAEKDLTKAEEVTEKKRKKAKSKKKTTPKAEEEQKPTKRKKKPKDSEVTDKDINLAERLNKIAAERETIQGVVAEQAKVLRKALDDSATPLKNLVELTNDLDKNLKRISTIEQILSEKRKTFSPKAVETRTAEGPLAEGTAVTQGRFKKAQDEVVLNSKALLFAKLTQSSKEFNDALDDGKPTLKELEGFIKNIDTALTAVSERAKLFTENFQIDSVSLEGGEGDAKFDNALAEAKIDLASAKDLLNGNITLADQNAKSMGKVADETERAAEAEEKRAEASKKSTPKKAAEKAVEPAKEEEKLSEGVQKKQETQNKLLEEKSKIMLEIAGKANILDQSLKDDSVTLKDLNKQAKNLRKTLKETADNPLFGTFDTVGDDITSLAEVIARADGVLSKTKDRIKQLKSVAQTQTEDAEEVTKPKRKTRAKRPRPKPASDVEAPEAVANAAKATERAAKKANTTLAEQSDLFAQNSEAAGKAAESTKDQGKALKDVKTEITGANTEFQEFLAAQKEKLAIEKRLVDSLGSVREETEAIASAEQEGLAAAKERTLKASDVPELIAKAKAGEKGTVGKEETPEKIIADNQKRLDQFKTEAINSFGEAVNGVLDKQVEGEKRASSILRKTFRNLVKELVDGNITVADAADKVKNVILQSFGGDLGISRGLSDQFKTAFSGAIENAGPSIEQDLEGAVQGFARILQREFTDDSSKVKLVNETVKIREDELSIINDESRALGELLGFHRDTILATAQTNDNVRETLVETAKRIQAERRINEVKGVSNLSDEEAIKLAKSLKLETVELNDEQRKGLTIDQQRTAEAIKAREELRSSLGGSPSAPGSTPRPTDAGGNLVPQTIEARQNLEKLKKEITATAIQSGDLRNAQLKAGSAVTNFNEQLVVATQKIIRYRIAFIGMQKALQAFTDGFKTITAVELGIARIAKVVDTATLGTKNLADAGFGLAIKFGQPVETVIESIKVFAQAGFSLTQSLQLSNAALLGVNGANLELEKSTNLLITAVKTYNFEMAEMTSVIDKVIAVQANHAITSTDLADALRIVGASAANVSLRMDEFFGIVTAIAAVTRKSGREIGNSLKTMFARFTRPEPIRELQDGLLDFEVAVFNTSGSLRNMGDILQDINLIWGDLTNTERINIATAVGGTRRYADFVVLMNNFDEAIAATKDSLAAQGDGLRANALELATLDGLLRQLGQVFKKELNDVFRADLPITALSFFDQVKNSVIGLSVVVKSVAKIFPNGLLPQLLIGGAVGGAFKFGRDSLKGAIAAAKETQQAASLARSFDVPKLTEGIFGGKQSTAAFETRLKFFKNLNKEQRSFIFNTLQTSNAVDAEDIIFRRFGVSVKALNANQSDLIDINTKLDIVFDFHLVKLKFMRFRTELLAATQVKATLATKAWAASTFLLGKAAAVATTSLNWLWAVTKRFLVPMAIMLVVGKALEFVLSKIAKNADTVNTTFVELANRTKENVVRQQSLIKIEENALKRAEDLVDITKKLIQVRDALSKKDIESLKVNSKIGSNLQSLAIILEKSNVEYKNGIKSVKEFSLVSGELNKVLDKQKLALARNRAQLAENQIAFIEEVERNLNTLGSFLTKARSEMDNFAKEQAKAFTDENLFDLIAVNRSRDSVRGLKEFEDDYKKALENIKKTAEEKGLNLEESLIPDPEKAVNGLKLIRKNILADAELDDKDIFDPEVIKRIAKEYISVTGKVFSDIESINLSLAQTSREGVVKALVAINSGLKNILILTRTQKNKIKSSIVKPFIEVQEALRKTNKELLDFKFNFVQIGETFNDSKTDLDELRKGIEKLIDLRQKIRVFGQLDGKQKELLRTLRDLNLAGEEFSGNQALGFDEVSVLIDETAERLRKYESTLISLTGKNDELSKSQREAAQSSIVVYTELGTRLKELASQTAGGLGLDAIKTEIEDLGLENFDALQDFLKAVNERKKGKTEEDRAAAQKRATAELVKIQPVLTRYVNDEILAQQKKFFTLLRISKELEIQKRKAERLLELDASRLESIQSTADAFGNLTDSFSLTLSIEGAQQDVIAKINKQFQTLIAQFREFGPSGNEEIVLADLITTEGIDAKVAELKRKLEAGELFAKSPERQSALKAILENIAFERELLSIESNRVLVLEEFNRKLRDGREISKTIGDLVKIEADARKEIVKATSTLQSSALKEEIRAREQQLQLTQDRLRLETELFNITQAQLAEIFDNKTPLTENEKIIAETAEEAKELVRQIAQLEIKRGFADQLDQMLIAMEGMKKAASDVANSLIGSLVDLPKLIQDTSKTRLDLENELVKAEEQRAELIHNLNTEIEAGTEEFQRTQKQIRENGKEIERIKQNIKTDTGFLGIAKAFTKTLADGINDAFSQARTEILKDIIKKSLEKDLEGLSEAQKTKDIFDFQVQQKTGFINVLKETFKSSADILKQSIKDGFKEGISLEEASRIRIQQTSLGEGQFVKSNLFKARLTPQIEDRVKEIAENIGVAWEDLITVIAFETANTFDPTKQNPKSSATGLIQFLESTLTDYGTTTEEIMKMSALEQLDLVEKYLLDQKAGGRLPNNADLAQLYVSILRPASNERNDGIVIDSETDPRDFNDNKAAFETTKDGVITMDEISSRLGDTKDLWFDFVSKADLGFRNETKQTSLLENIDKNTAIMSGQTSLQEKQFDALLKLSQDANKKPAVDLGTTQPFRITPGDTGSLVPDTAETSAGVQDVLGIKFGESISDLTKPLEESLLNSITFLEDPVKVPLNRLSLEEFGIEPRPNPNDLQQIKAEGDLIIAKAALLRDEQLVLELRQRAIEAEAKSEAADAGKSLEILVKKQAAAGVLSLGGGILTSLVGTALPSPGGANFGGSVGGALGNLLPGLLGIGGGPIGAAAVAVGGGLLGTLLGGLFGSKTDKEEFDPDIFNNTAALNDNTLALRDNTRVLGDLRPQLINAPSSFSLPAFSGLGGGVFAPTASININVQGATTPQIAQQIGQETAIALDEVYENQARKFGFQRRIS